MFQPMNASRERHGIQRKLWPHRNTVPKLQTLASILRRFKPQAVARPISSWAVTDRDRWVAQRIKVVGGLGFLAGQIDHYIGVDQRNQFGIGVCPVVGVEPTAENW